MSPADITDLRARACRVITEMGFALHSLNELEAYLSQPAPSPLLAGEAADMVANYTEAASAELAELVAAADQCAEALRPRGEQPGDMPADDEPDYGPGRCDGRNSEHPFIVPPTGGGAFPPFIHPLRGADE